MLLRFKLKGVDHLLSFILAVIDIVYALLGILNFCLYLSISGKYQEGKIYCIVSTSTTDCLGTLGFNTIVVLAVVRYLAICKKCILSKPLALTILLVISSIPITGILITIFNNQLKLNSKIPICSFDIPFDSVYKKLSIWLNVHHLVYLATISVCYLQIMRYYSKIHIVLTECEAACSINTGIETGKDTQTCQCTPAQSESSQKSYNTSANTYSTKSSSLSNIYKSQKLLPILKITLIILIYYVEIVPYYSIQIYLSITDDTKGVGELSVQIASMLVNYIPLTNTFLILFIHEETWQEVRLWGAIWGNWIKRVL